MKLILFILALILLSACASRSVLPDVKEIKVTREVPSKDCREIGTLTGRTASAQGTQEQALEDLKSEAANKGANYLVVKEYSSYGTSVTGIAYDCP